MNRKLVFTLFYYLSPLILVGTMYNADPDKYLYIKSAIPSIIGTFAYVWLIYEFVISSRPKFVEKYFGMDKFYRFHGYMGVVAVLAVFIHKETIWGGNLSAREFGDWSFDIFIAIVIFTLIFMVDSFVMRIKMISWIKKLFEKTKLFRYEHYVVVHSMTVLGLIAMYIHVMKTGSADDTSVALAYTVFFAVGILFYLYHRVFKILILKSRYYIVKDLKKENNSIWTLKLYPSKGKVMNYKPGQFGFFRILGRNIKPEEHPFSFSSQPENKEYITVTVKSLGDYTSKINHVEIGDKVFVDGPYGTFSYVSHSNEENVLLIAGGVGITPMLGMIRHMRAVHSDKKVTLLWGARNSEELICLNEIEEIRNEMKNFQLVTVMSNDDSATGFKGYVDKNIIEEVLSSFKYDITETGFYICGPAPMQKNVLKTLKVMDIKKKHIHYEKFSL